MAEIYSIVKELGLDVAHRVPLTKSKCFNMHGHRYTVFAEVSGENLVTTGPQSDMILDFSFLKNLMVEHIDAKCDHGIILSIQDMKMLGMAYNDRAYKDIYSSWINSIQMAIHFDGFWSGETNFGKTYVIENYPTAEALAAHWFSILAPKVLELTNNKAQLTAITVQETPTSTATFRKSYVA
jgi:6-pyruvoyltetrahydropterin/6-carboxytetrahydropterin synthase